MTARRSLSGIFLWLFLAAQVFAGNLVVTFLDCGQGDAAVLKTPGGKTYLIDAGPSDEGYGGSFDAGKQVIVPFLRSRNVKEIETLLISHPHLDHYGGAVSVLRSFPVQEVVDPGLHSLAPPYLALLQELHAANIRYGSARKGDRLNWDPELDIEVLWPSPEILNKQTGKKMEDLNDRSIVLKISHGKNTFLFPGDVEKPAEAELVSLYGKKLSAKVLKVPHHASKTSSTDVFLTAVRPQVAVISCGRNNRFGHPFPAVLERFQARKISYYRTDTRGSVEITSDGETLDVKLISSPK